MKKQLLLVLISLLITGFYANAQYVTGAAPVQDGNISAGEYYNSSGSGWFMCWDNTYLYIARTAGSSSEPCIVYLDVNPTSASNGGAAVGSNGSLTGKNDYNVTPKLPFVAKARLYFLTNGGSYAEVTTNSGSGWSAPTTIITQMGTSLGTNFELKVTWAQLGATGGTLPASFNWLGTETSTSNPGYIYAQVPSINYGGNGSYTPTYYYYQSVVNTSSSGTTNPFSASFTSFSNYDNGSYGYTGSLPTTLYDVNIGNSSSTGNVDMQTNLTVNGNLVVKNGVLNSSGSYTISMTNSNGQLNIFTASGGHVYGTDNFHDLSLKINTGATTTVGGDAATGFTDDHKFYNINVQSGATLALGRGILSRYGTFTVNGTIQINANGYIEGSYGSSIAASYSGAASNLIYNNGGDYTATNFEWPTTSSPTNVIIQNSGTNVILNNSKSISGTLTLTTGKITTGANILSVAAAGTVSRTSGWVNGNLSRAFSTGSSIALTYDIGNATSWMPTSLNVSSATVAGSVTIATVDGKHANYSTSGLHSTKYINRNWNVTVNGGTFTGAQLQFNYLAADLSGGAAAANIKGIRYTGSAWAYPTTAATSSYSFTNNGMSNTTLSQSFTGGECAGDIVLPAPASNSPVCANGTLNLNGAAVSSGGIGTINYSWTGPNSFSAASLTSSISNATTAATGTYTITATDAAGCTATKTLSATVNANITPSVSLSPSGTINNASQTFTATASNTGGGVVTYTFLKGITIMQTSIANTWNATGLVNGDVISCVISIIGGSCLTTSNNIISNQTSVCVSGITPALGITPTTATNAATTFTAIAINTGGGVVTYDFKKNNITQQSSTSASWSATGLVTGDVITCSISITGGSCLLQTTANSTNSVTACINPATPSVNIGVDINPVCAGTLVTFTATPTAATSPSYAWFKGASQVGTGITYSSSSLANSDAITCVMTASNVCGSSNNFNSNTIVMNVNSATNSSTPVTSCGSYTWNGQTYASSGTYSKTFTGGNAKGCDSTATLVLTVNTPDTWTGTTNSDWNTASNWACGTVPSNGADITIPAAVNYPVLSGAISVGAISIASGASVSLNGYSFTINGTVSGTGTIKGSGTSSLVYNAATSNALYFGSTASDSLLGNLTISGAGTLTLGTGIGITTSLNVNSGGLTIVSHLTLKSTSIANTAVVGPVAGTITGSVTVERFIPQGNRAYRDLAPAVANAGAIYNNWQERGSSPAGYGMYITGVKAASPGGVDATTGLDKTASGNPSLYIYAAGTWPSVTNTKSTNLDPFMGYRASVRGDRTYNIYGSDPTTMANSTTLRTTGNLVTGNVLFTTTNVTSNVFTSTAAKLQSGINNFNLVANPYACPIDWETVYANAGTQNITSSYWYFDPTFMSAGYATYVTYNAVSHVNSNPVSKVNKYIQPGMAFFVQNSNSSNPALSITESNKAPNSTKTAVFRTEAPNYIHASLWKNINGNNTNVDGAVAVFNNNFTRTIGDKDSKKLMNGGENIFITQSNTDLSIAGLPVPTENEEITLNLSQLVVGNTYQLQVDAGQFTTTGVEAFIKDKLLNKLVPAAEGICFIPTKDIASYQDRFSIVFKTAEVNPVIVKGAISIYPNPVSNNTFNLQMNNLEKGKYTVVVMNSLGQEVLNSTINNESETTLKSIPSKGLTTGWYTVQVKGKTGIYTTEMMVK